MKLFSFKTYWLILVLCMAGCLSKSPDTGEVGQQMLDKITFDLNSLNEDGLYGPPDGLRALDYEFCIPAQEKFAEAVKQIDPTVKIHPDASGRIGCTKDEYLCTGNTHQKNFKTVLTKLTSLVYVTQINESFFE